MRSPLPFSFALLAVVTLLPASARAEEAKSYDVKAVKDIAYYEGDDADKVKHKLDLYLPKEKESFPVFLFIHGGAWVHGDKNFLNIYSSLATWFAKHGVGVVVANYRLSPGVKHPEHIKDVARAFAWTYKNIEKYGGRPDEIFVGGHSAGGHLAALLATDESYLKAEGLSPKKIKGVMPISGVYIIPEKILSSVFGKDDEVHKQASPINHVSADLPPFLILYADQDMAGCDKAPSEAFCKALKEKGNKATTMELKDSNHFKILLDIAAGKGSAPQALLDFIADRTAMDEKNK
jgi:arylformamidase